MSEDRRPVPEPAPALPVLSAVPGGGARSLRSDLLAGDVGSDARRCSSAHINQQHLMPPFADTLSDEGMFIALGIEGSENGDGSHDAYRLMVIDLNWRVRFVSDSSTPMRSRLEAPTKPTQSVA